MRIVVLAVLLGSVPARADDSSTQFLGVGLITSVSGGHHSMAGIGVEATLVSFHDDIGSDAWGAYVQAETGGPPMGSLRQLGDDKRYAAGFLYIHDFYGVEAGALYRTSPDTAATPGLQLGAFVTAGIVSIEARAGIASVGTPDHPQYGSDVGVVIAAKLPMQVGGKAYAIKDVQLLPCIWRCRPPKT